MVHKKEEGTYHHIEMLMKEMPGFLSPRRGLPLLLIPEYSGINKKQRIPDRSKTAHRKPPVKCFLKKDNAKECSKYHTIALKKQSSRKTSTSASFTMPKPSIVWITINCGKVLKRWECQTTLLAS